MTPEEELAALKAEIIAKAERQESFASLDYPHASEEWRQSYRHAAKMLRDLLLAIPKSGV